MPPENPLPLLDWHTYILECRDGSLYTGVTTDVERRVAEHNGTPRGARYTRGRRPVVLVYSEAHGDRQAACRAEARIKRLSRPAKQQLIATHD